MGYFLLKPDVIVKEPSYQTRREIYQLIRLLPPGNSFIALYDSDPLATKILDKILELLGIDVSEVDETVFTQLFDEPGFLVNKKPTPSKGKKQASTSYEKFVASIWLVTNSLSETKYMLENFTDVEIAKIIDERNRIQNPKEANLKDMRQKLKERAKNENPFFKPKTEKGGIEFVKGSVPKTGNKPNQIGRRPPNFPPNRKG